MVGISHFCFYAPECFTTLWPSSLHLRPFALRVIHLITCLDLWMSHTGSEDTKYSMRKLTHWKRDLNKKECESSWGFFLLFSLTNLSLQDSFHQPTWSRHTEGCFHMQGYQGLGAWSWLKRWSMNVWLLFVVGFIHWSVTLI